MEKKQKIDEEAQREKVKEKDNKSDILKRLGVIWSCCMLELG